jgi:fimbrial chaperone protein
MVRLAANENADGLWLTNTGEAPLHAQVRVYHWSQAGGEEKLDASRGLLISPPMLNLEPGARQLVRVIRTSAPPAEIEDSYRVIVDELPVDEPAAKDAPAPGHRGALQFVLRYSIPVFLAPKTSAPIAPKLSSSVRREGDVSMLEVSNSGSEHAQLGNLVLVDAQGKRSELSSGLLGYVLPGQTMRWPLKASAQALASGGSLLSRINSEPAERTLAALAAAP